MGTFNEKEYKRNYYQKNKEKISEKAKIYRSKNKDKISIQKSKWEEKNIEHVREHKRKYIKKYRQLPDVKFKDTARLLLKTEIRAGRMNRQPCEVCGINNGVQGHHEDYSKPLEVIWLCRKHHRQLHMWKTDVEDLRSLTDAQNWINFTMGELIKKGNEKS